MEIEKGELDGSGQRAVESFPLQADPVKRGIGRPKYAGDLNGRRQIISQTREYMKINPFHDVQRKEIAKFSGVTPALVSYYFPEKYDLIFEASSVVVISYSVNVTNILKGTRPILERTKDLVSEFVNFHLLTGHTLDYYLHSIQRRNKRNELSLMAEQYAEILRFMEELIAFSNQSELQASFLQSAIWGQCMYLGRQPHLQSIVGESGRAEVSAGLTESIFKLLMNGLHSNQSPVIAN